MYYYLNGKLALCNQSLAVIDCGGVGYKCAISKNTFLQIKDKSEIKLFTYLNVKEDALDIFGFATEKEKQFFELLLSVSGVGPKASLAVLSELPPDILANAILTSNARIITSAQGVGPKMAQRICLELRDKISKLGAEEALMGVAEISAISEASTDAVAALLALGYTKADAENAIRKCSAENTEDLIRQALRLLSKHI